MMKRVATIAPATAAKKRYGFEITPASDEAKFSPIHLSIPTTLMACVMFIAQPTKAMRLHEMCVL